MPRSAQAYALTETGLTFTEADFKGHQRAIFKALQKGPATVAEIARMSRIKTKSSRPERIVAFYCTALKNVGVLDFEDVVGDVAGNQLPSDGKVSEAELVKHYKRVGKKSGK